jgi:hypothetical protein
MNEYPSEKSREERERDSRQPERDQKKQEERPRTPLDAMARKQAGQRFLSDEDIVKGRRSA